MPRLPAKFLERATHPERERELQLVAVAGDGTQEKIIGGTRYAALADAGDCEFAVAIVDEWHGLGLARPLLETLMRIARARGFQRMEGYVLATNTRMLGLAKRLMIRILQASTSEVYGDPTVHPQPEEYWGNVNPVGIRSCYDEGKRCAETLFFDYRRQHNLPVKVVRIFNTYGPRMHPHDGRVVSNFIVQALRGEDITIYGDGSQTRSFCYVDDLIEGMLRMMATSPEVTGPINIGNPNEFAIRELAELIIKITDTKSRLKFERLPSDDPKQRRPDISTARTILAWEPTTQLREGLVKTIAYFDQLLSEGAMPALTARQPTGRC